MTVTVDLNPEVEVGLSALARAKGVPLQVFLRVLLELFATPAAGADLTPEQKANAFEQGADNFPDVPVLSDEAMSREAIYRRDDGSPR